MRLSSQEFKNLDQHKMDKYHSLRNKNMLSYLQGCEIGVKLFDSSLEVRTHTRTIHRATTWEFTFCSFGLPLPVEYVMLFPTTVHYIYVAVKAISPSDVISIE